MRLVEEGGEGGLRSKTNELMIFFRIKDNIIVAKSVLIAEKALHLRQFFANKVKTRCKMATQIHETPAKKLVYKKRIIIDIFRSI